MHKTIALVAGASFALLTAMTQANANPAVGSQLRPLEIEVIGRSGGVQKVHSRSYRHCHRRVRRCSTVLRNGRRVQSCRTVRRAYCHGPQRRSGSHAG